MLRKWLGVLEATAMLGGLGGLLTGLSWLATKPFVGVMAILASMTLLLSSVAKLGKAQEVRDEYGVGQGAVSRRRVRGYDR